METKHTPGPWHINCHIFEEFHASPTGRHLKIVSDNTERPDVITINAENFQVCRLDRKLNIKEDARLIAAAPEMYEACKILYTENGEADEKTQTVTLKLSFADMAKIAAAIAKAEGRG